MHPASAWCWATCTLVFPYAHAGRARSLACSPPSPLTSARLPLRVAGVGSVPRHLHAGLAPPACVRTAVAFGLGVDRCVQPASAQLCKTGLASLGCVLATVAAGFSAASACSWCRLDACCATCTPVLLCSLAGSPPSPLAPAHLFRAAGVGPTPRHPHAGLASPTCGLTAIAVGFGSASACGRRRPSAAPLASWSRFARSPAPCRRRRRWRGTCAQPASARCCTACALVWPYSLACCRRCRWLRRGLCVQLVSARYRATRALAPLQPLACSSPLPSASAWPLRAAGVGSALRATCAPVLLACLRACRRRCWLPHGFFACASGISSVLRHSRAGPALPVCVLAAVAVGFGATSACSRRRLGALPLACWARLARLRARRRRRWLQRDFRVHPEPAQRCALALWSRSARLRARRRRRWLRRGVCVHPRQLDPSHLDELPGTSSGMPL